MSSFFAELRRRSVFKVGAAYAIVAWLIAQVSELVLDAIPAPHWVFTTLLYLLAIGFPLALLLAWAYELTPEGIKLTRAAASEGKEIAPTPVALPATGATSSEQSIAVLPFVNMSSDPEQEYFSDGIAEELLNQLTKLRGLHVAGRTSSFHFKGRNDDLRVIGEQLNVAHVLEGSVRKSGNRVRITAQLVKARDGYHLWSETFDRDLDDIFAIQDETAKAVAKALSIALGVGEASLGAGGTRNFQAYDAFLAARALRYREGRENYISAIEQYERTVRLDPEFASAWAELAFTNYVAAHSFLSERAGELLSEYENAVARAVAIAPDSVAGLRAAAMGLWGRNRDYRSAERYLKRACELAPADAAANNETGVVLLALGRPREALDYLERQFKSEPLSVQAARMLAHTYEISGDLDRALEQYRLAATLPGEHLLVYGPMMALAMAMGNHGLIKELSAKLLAMRTISPQLGSFTRTMAGLLDSPAAAVAELRRVSHDPASSFPLMHMVIPVYAAYFGDHELALEVFLAARRDFAFAPMVLWRPIHAPMRRLPGFKTLVRELGLVNYWRASGNWGEFCRPIGDDDFECI